MIDLKNTYIENDKGELRDLYVAECAKQGLKEFSEMNADSDYLECCTAISEGLAIYGVLFSGEIYNTSTQVTLADLKPRTKVEYVKCTESNTCAWDLKEMLSNGELFSKSSAGGYAIYSNAAPAYMLSQFIEYGVYRKVEAEITWQSEVVDSMDAISLNCTIAHFIDFNPEKLIKMCHLVSSMTDNPSN